MVGHRGLQFYGLIAGLALCVSSELWCHPPEHCYFGCLGLVSKLWLGHILLLAVAILDGLND